MTDFVEWYQANKEVFNRKRRLRYMKDPVYRKKQQENAKRWRKAHPKREIQRAPKTTFSIGEVAENLGCSIIVIRTYERKGLIPSTSVEGKHRRYTVTQQDCIGRLYQLRTNYHHKDPRYTKLLTAILVHIAKNWNK